MNGHGELIVNPAKIARDRVGDRGRSIGALALWTTLVLTQWLDPSSTFWLGALGFWTVCFAARYGRERDTWRFADFGVFGATIYATGGAESFLFWLPLMRVDANPDTPRGVALGYAACAPLTFAAAATLAGGFETWASAAFLLRLSVVASLAAFLLLRDAKRSALRRHLRRALDRARRQATELRRQARTLEHRAGQAEDWARLRGSLPASMSRGLRGPARSVLEGGRSLLRSGLDPGQRRTCEVIHASAETLLAGLDDLAELSADRVEPASIPMSWTHLLRDVAALARANGPQAPDVRCVVDPEVPRYVLGDPVRIKQVLLTLIAAPPARSVEVRVGLAVPGLRVEIRADGDSIRPSGDTEASDLRLLVARGWVMAMKGSLTLGEGSALRVDLPLRPYRPESAAAAKVA